MGCHRNIYDRMFLFPRQHERVLLANKLALSSWSAHWSPAESCSYSGAQLWNNSQLLTVFSRSIHSFFPFPSLSSSPEVVTYINIIPEKPTISDLIFVERISNSLEFSAYWSQKFRVSFVFAYWNNEQQLISRCQRWLRRRSSGFHEKTRQPARATSPENSGSHPQSFSRVRLYCFVFFWAHNPEEKLNKEKS